MRDLIILYEVTPQQRLNYTPFLQAEIAVDMTNFTFFPLLYYFILFPT